MEKFCRTWKLEKMPENEEEKRFLMGTWGSLFRVKVSADDESKYFLIQRGEGGQRHVMGPVALDTRCCVKQPNGVGLCVIIKLSEDAKSVEVIMEDPEDPKKKMCTKHTLIDDTHLKMEQETPKMKVTAQYCVIDHVESKEDEELRGGTSSC